MYTFTVKAKNKDVFEAIKEGFSVEDANSQGFEVKENTDNTLVLYTEKTAEELENM